MKIDFRTTFSFPSPDVKLDHQDSFLLLGSCFSENMEKKLSQCKFDCLSNPLGIAYNPISLHQLLTLELPLKSEQKEGIFYSYQLHSSCNQLTEERFHEKVQAKFEKQQEQLRKKTTLILTYGTAWVYELKEEGKVVNNCHKAPASLFNKRLLSIDEILQSWQKTHALLVKEYPNLQIIFTLSPVRHLKDGVQENQLSKSILRLAIQEICESFSHCSYFPSYEIMMDDLRDYRFYTSDLIHPNNIAIDYIWNQFEQYAFSESTLQLIQDISKVNHSLQHKAFQPSSEKHQQFLKKLLSKMEDLQKKNGISFKNEIATVSTQIN